MLLVLAGPVWYRRAWYRVTYVLCPEKRHGGECADGEKTAAVVTVAGALLGVGGGG